MDTYVYIRTSAYEFYKQMYGNLIIWFRVGNFYVTYLDDALRVAGVLKLETRKTRDIPRVTVGAEQIFDYVELLSECGIESKLIECRNSYGQFDVPDVNELIAESKIDY